MKFTKEQAFESLKRELTNNDRKTLRMSTKSLDKLTDTLIGEFADDEIGLPDFCTKAMTILSVVNDNVGKDKSDFIKQWESEHPVDNETPKEEKHEGGKPENPEMKALLERIAVLEKDKAESAKNAAIAQKRKDVVAKLKEKGVKDDDWMNGFLSEVNITEDMDVDVKADSWVKLYNKSKANGGSPVPPANPAGGASDNPYAQVIKAASAMAKNERAKIETK